MFQQGDNTYNKKRKQPSSPTNQSFFRNIADSLLNIVPRSITEWFKPSESKQQPNDSTVEQITERLLLPPPKKKRRYVPPTQSLLEPTYNMQTTSYYSATDEGFNVTRGRLLKHDEILNRVERWVQEPSSTMENYSKFNQDRGSIKCIDENARLSKKRAYDSRDEAIFDTQNLEDKSCENEEPNDIQYVYKNKLDKCLGHKTIDNNDVSSQEISQTRPQKKRCLNTNSVCEESDALKTAQRESPKAEDKSNTCISPRKTFQERCAEILTPQPNVHSTSWKRLQSRNSSCAAKVNETNNQDSIDWTKGQSTCSAISDESKAKKSNSSNIFSEISMPHLKRVDFNDTSVSRNTLKSSRNNSYKTQNVHLHKQAAIISMKAKLRINRDETTVSGSKTSNSIHKCSSNVVQPQNKEPVNDKSGSDTKCDSSAVHNNQIESPKVTHTDKNTKSPSCVSVSTQTSSTVKRKIEKSPSQRSKNTSKIKLVNKSLETNVEKSKLNKNTSTSASNEAPELEKQLTGKETQEANNVVKNQKDLDKIAKESDMINNEGINEVDEIPRCDSQKDEDKILAETSSNNKSDTALNKITNKPTDKWECTICLVKNDNDLPECACCKAPKPSGCEQTEPKGFSFGMKSDSAFNKIVKTQDNRWECNICTVKNDNNLSKCVCCDEPKPGEYKETDVKFNFGQKSDNVFNKIVSKQADKWECSICLVKNDNSLSKCVCCGGPKPGESKETGSNSFNIGVKLDNAFKTIVNSQADKWECPNCLVRNDNSLIKCDCCDAPKPGGCTETGSNSFNFGVKSENALNKIVNTQADKWTCTTCLVKNDMSLTKCACCEAAKPGSSNKTISNSFNFGVKGNTFGFEIPKVNFKFGIPKEATVQPVNPTLQENVIKKQDTQTIVTDNLLVPTVNKVDESNNTKEFTPFIATNLFNPPIATAASASPQIATNISALPSISTPVDTNFTLKKSDSINLIQTSIENTHSASNPFARNNNSTNLLQQTTERNVFCNPSTNLVPSTDNIHANTTTCNPNTKFPNFCFTATDTAKTSSVSPFTSNNASSGSFKEQTNAINTNIPRKGIALSSSTPALTFGAGTQDKITPLSKSSTNALQSSQSFTFGIPLNTNSGNGNIFGLKPTNIFTAPQKSDSHPPMFASPVNPNQDIFGNLQSNNSPITSVPVFGNPNIPKVAPINNSLSPFMSSNQTLNNIFGGSQSSSTSSQVGNIFGNSPATHQAPAVGVFGNTNNVATTNANSSPMFTSGNQTMSMFSTPQPAGNQLPVLGNNVFGNTNMPAAITTKNDPPSMFTSPNQQTPIIFGSNSSSAGSQGSAVAVFGNSNAPPQAGNVFSMLSNPAPSFETSQAPRPLGNNPIFNFGQKQTPQQPAGVYNFAGNQSALPQFNMGSSPISNIPGRRLRKAVRRNCQR